MNTKALNNNLLSFIIKYNRGNKMAKAIISLGEREDRVLTIVKGKYGLKNKSDAVNFVISKFEDEILEPQLKPEFIEEMLKFEKTNKKYKTFSSVEELRKLIKNA